jgi:hypothetical protein
MSAFSLTLSQVLELFPKADAARMAERYPWKVGKGQGAGARKLPLDGFHPFLVLGAVRPETGGPVKIVD